MIRLNDQETWPAVASRWKHHNGIVYHVVFITNIDSSNQDKYPTSIVYQNIKNYKIYSRPLIDWERSMTKIVSESK